MASILNIGTNALLAFQRAMVTTGNNVANANTDGYSRQRAEFTTQTPQRLGTSYLGSGVKLESVRRQYDDFLAGQVRGSQSSTSELEAYYKYASQIDNMVADPDTGLDPALQDFFDALQGLSNDPGSIPSRQLLLSETASLVDRFHDFDTQLQDIQERMNGEIGSQVDEINRLADGVAELNLRITSAPGIHEGTWPNDLLDQRDQLINELSRYVSVTTLPQDDGAINVYFGKGQALVLDEQAFTLEIVDSKEVPGRKEIGYRGAGSGNLVVTQQITGGELGGLLRVRDEMLEPARQQVGLVATGLAFAINAQHRQGIDLDGQTNQNYFTDLTVSNAIPRVGNAGTGSIQATITDPSQLAASDYRLSLSAGIYSLTRLSDNSLVYSGAALPAPGSLAVGFDLGLTAGAVANGDSFLIRPVFGSALAIDRAITDPRDIAAAAVGGGVSDNRNVLLMAHLQQTDTMLADASGNPTASFQDTFANFVAFSGSRTRQANVAMEAQQGLLEINRDALQAVSGVNLDEEAADLVRFQQAYQAAAKVITTAQSVFDTMINMVR